MALSWLRRTPEPMPQLARWLMLIEQHDYEVVHRAGKTMETATGQVEDRIRELNQPNRRQ